jgi:hypothetical protein
VENGYSPLLSLLTGLFEVGAAVWCLYQPGRWPIRRMVFALLLVLAGYQFMEILVCTQLEQPLLARLAFADVVWLPSIGLSLMLCIGRFSGWVHHAVRGCWVGAAALTAWMLIDQRFVIGTVCSTVFATHEHGTPFHHVFGAYYELALAGLIVGCGAGMVSAERALDRAHLLDLQLGILGFLVPAMLTQIIMRDLDPSLPSIMCHYALVLALLLVRMVRREARAQEQ